MQSLGLVVAISLALLVHAGAFDFEDCSSRDCDVAEDNCRINKTCTDYDFLELLEQCWLWLDQEVPSSPLRRKRSAWADQHQPQPQDMSWYDKGSQGFKGWARNEDREQKSQGSQGDWYDQGSQQNNGFKGWSGNEQRRNPGSQEWSSGQWHDKHSQQNNGFKGWSAREDQGSQGNMGSQGEMYNRDPRSQGYPWGWQGRAQQYPRSYYPLNKRGYDQVMPSRGSTYRSFHYKVPKPSYRRSFREGNWHLDNKHLVKNYYKKGTYETAKKYFIALPFVKIIPVTKTNSVDYVGHLQTYNGYKARLCEHCGHGSPQIEFQSISDPYKNVIRRFNFLPDTKRTRTEYGTPKLVQTGGARISPGKETSRHVEH